MSKATVEERGEGNGFIPFLFLLLFPFTLVLYPVQHYFLLSPEVDSVDGGGYEFVN